MVEHDPVERAAGSADKPAPPRGLVARIWAFNDWYLHRLPGGAGRMQPRQVINLHKLTVGPLVACLMVATGNLSLTAWLYLALHGVYGILWVVKDVAFPDQSWRQPSSVGSAIAVFVYPLGLYYLAPLVIFTPLGTLIPGGWGSSASLPMPVAFAAAVCFLLGSFLHFVGDAQ